MSHKIFVTSQPRLGKSTVIKKVVDVLGRENCYGFYTEEIMVAGKREGFKIITMDGRQGILASTGSPSALRLGRYGLNIDTLEDLCLGSILEGNDPHKVLIIDEVGPMQVWSESFRVALEKALERDNPMLGSVFLQAHPWIDTFKARDELDIVDLNLANRDGMVQELVSKFRLNNLIT